MVSIETRKKILKDVGLDDFLDEAKEYCLHIDSGVCIRFPEGVDLKNRANEITDKLEKNISDFLDEVRSGIPEGNELEGNCRFLTSVEEDNVIIRFRNLQFEQYGEDVDFLEELFELGNQVSKTIEEYIKDFKNKPIDEDIYVVSDEKIFKELESDQLYLNDFSFYQLKEYESSSVTLIDEEGNRISVPYGKEISSILKKSGVYTIEEENPYGKSIYQAIYIKENENTAVAKLSYIDKDGKSVIQEISQKSSSDIKAKALYLADLKDRLDKYTLVTIKNKKTNAVVTYMATELSGLIMNYKGEYEFTFINRLGYSYSFNVEILETGNTFNWRPHVDNSHPLVLGETE